MRHNSGVDAPSDEFSFLPEQAAELGVDPPLPNTERVGITLDDGRTISGIRFGESPPRVTLLHGAGLNAHTWDSTVLAMGLPALAIDLPGHGDSSWRADAHYTPGIIAPDVAAAIAAFTDRPQLLVGHSLGGLTAAAVAAAHPESVRTIVIIDITPGVDPNAGPTQIRDFFAGPTDWASRDELVDRALAFGLGGERRAAERGVFLNTRIRPDGRVEWKHHFAHLAAAASNAPAGGDAVSRVLDESGWEALVTVTAPVTLIRGDHGYVTETDAAAFARRLPAARIEVFPTGHNVHEEQPAALGRWLRAEADRG